MGHMQSNTRSGHRRTTPAMGKWEAVDAAIVAAFHRGGLEAAIVTYRHEHRALTGRNPDGSENDIRLEVEDTVRVAMEQPQHGAD